MTELQSGTPEIKEWFYSRVTTKAICPHCNKNVRQLDYKSGLCERCHMKSFARHIMEKGNHVVYCKLNHVSRSGMSRAIGFMTIIDNEPYKLDGIIARLCEYKFNKHHEGLTVSGCGMDMGFAVVYDFSCVLYNPGPKYDHDKAYTLKHSWL